MKKKIITIIAVLLVAALAFTAYWFFLGPRGTAGDKQITIRVIVENEDIDKTFTYDTDLEFLGELVKEKQEDLGATLNNMGGSFVEGMMDYVADSTNNEFFSIKINTMDAMVGIDEIPLNDGETYTFELTTW